MVVILDKQDIELGRDGLRFKNDKHISCHLMIKHDNIHVRISLKKTYMLELNEQITLLIN